MNKLSLLGRKIHKINDLITIRIPKVDEIWGSKNSHEKEYLAMASLFIQTPTDMMIELDDMGLDWTEISEYDLFVITMSAFLANKNNTVSSTMWDSVFIGLDHTNISMQIDKAGTEYIFVNSNGEVIFDKRIYELISEALCNILFTTKNREYAKVPEKDTRRYILDRARLKRKRHLERLNNNTETTSSSVLDGIILFLVNHRDFKYDFETVKKLSVYDLYASFKQINKNQEVDGLMTGYWYGNVDLSKISDSKLKRIIL